MGFRDVKSTREMQARDRSTMSTNDRGITSFGPGLQTGGQVADLGGGKFAVAGGDPTGHGDTSPNFYDDPTVNSVVKLPSQKEAEQYTGASPSFYGVQRPGDWQRAVQRQMAEDVVGKGALNRAGEARVRRAQFGSPQ